MKATWFIDRKATAGGWEQPIVTPAAIAVAVKVALPQNESITVATTAVKWGGEGKKVWK